MRHAFPDVTNDPQYVPLSSLPRAQQLFNYAALTPAMAPVTVNTSTARSTTKYAINIWSSLRTSIRAQFLGWRPGAGPLTNYRFFTPGRIYGCNSPLWNKRHQ